MSHLLSFYVIISVFSLCIIVSLYYSCFRASLEKKKQKKHIQIFLDKSVIELDKKEVVQNLEKIPDNNLKVITTDSDERPLADKTPKDEFEGWFFDVQKPFPVKATLCIDYEDGGGKKTNRTVDVRQFGATNYGYILIGNCRLRNATRTFRINRIKQCVDEETGEIINNVIDYLQKKYEDSPDRSLDTFFETRYDVLRILLFIGKADGQLRKAERIILRDFCRTLINDNRLSDGSIDNLFNSIEVPSYHAFKLAVGRLAKEEQPFHNMLIQTAEKIVATDKKIYPIEEESLAYMRKRLQHRVAEKIADI